MPPQQYHLEWDILWWWGLEAARLPMTEPPFQPVAPIPRSIPKWPWAEGVVLTATMQLAVAVQVVVTTILQQVAPALAGKAPMVARATVMPVVAVAARRVPAHLPPPPPLVERVAPASPAQFPDRRSFTVVAAVAVDMAGAQGAQGPVPVAPIPPQPQPPRPIRAAVAGDRSIRRIPPPRVRPAS